MMITAIPLYQALMKSVDAAKSAARRMAWEVDTKWDDYNPFSRKVSRGSGRTLSQGAVGNDEEAAIDACSGRNQQHVLEDDTGTLLLEVLNHFLLPRAILVR